MNLIPGVPDWVLILVGLFVMFIIYYYLPDESKKAVRSIISSYGIYIGLFLVWIYWSNKTGAIFEFPDKWPAGMNRATFFCLMMAFMYFAFKNWLYEFRYNTNAFVCDNLHGSCHRVQEIGNVGDDNNWLVCFLGGSGPSDEFFCIPWPWPKKIVVVPKVACQYVGNQLVAFTQVSKVTTEELLELDEDVADFINNDPLGRWARSNVYVGYWDVQRMSRNPKYASLATELKKKNSRINELKEMLKGKLSTVKGFVSDTIAMQDKLKGKDWRKSNPPQED